MATINEQDPNNFWNSSGTSLITLGDTFVGSLSSSNDYDFCKFTVGSAGVLKIDFSSPVSSSSFYFGIGVYDSTGVKTSTVLAQDFTGSSTSFSLGLPGAGTYYLSVSSSTVLSTGQYRVTVGSGVGSAGDYEQEGNNTLQTANALTLAHAIKGQLSLSDADWFHVSATTAGTLVVDFAASKASSFPTFNVAIYNAAGTLLQTQQTGEALAFSTAVAGAGDYYLKVTQASSYDGGNYTLTAYNDSFAAMAAKPLAASSQVTLAGGHDWYALSLTAGRTYEFAAKGSSSAAGTLADPALSLVYGNGTTLENCDDLLVWSSTTNSSSSVADAQIAFTAPATGSYYLMLSGNGGTGTVTLSQTTDTVPGLIPALLESQLPPAPHRWEAFTDAPVGTGITLTYAFLSSSADDEAGFRAMSSTEQAAVVTVLGMYSRVADIRFTATTDVANADIRFGTSNQAGTSSGVTWSSNNSGGLIQADVFLNNTSSGSSSASTATLTPGGYGYLTLIHEIGHALGLKHPGDYNSTGGGTGGPYLPVSLDNAKFTTMSYLDNPDATIFSSTPALLDIAALQYLYGTPALSTQSFSYSNSTAFVGSLLGYGAADTLDISNQTLPSTVFLTSGSLSSIGAGSGSGVAHDNLGIPFTESVAYVINGPAADLIVGNSMNNKIYGFAGADTIDGGGGADTLVLTATSTDLNNAGDGQLLNMQTVDAAAATGSINIDLQRQSEAINIAGGSFADTIIAASGGGVVTGGAGNDSISGSLGNTLAAYAGARANYSVTVTTDGLTVQDKVGNEGTDTLTGIERAQFSATKYAFDLNSGPDLSDWNGSAGNTAKLIAAAFGTAHLHDSIGGQGLISIGLDAFDQGYSLQDIAGPALNSSLFQQLVGSSTPSTEAVVRLLYTNVVGEAPANADLQYFVGLGLSQPQLLTLAANSEANLHQLTLLGLPGNGLDYS